MKSFLVGGIALCAAIAAPSVSFGNLLINGGLEPTPVKLNSGGYMRITSATVPASLAGWTIAGHSIDLVPNAYWQATQGKFSVDLVGKGISSISQIVSGLTIGQEYELTFDFAINPETMFGEQNTTKVLDVTVVNSDLPGGMEQFTGTAGNRTKKSMQYEHKTIDFFANATSITLSFGAELPLNEPTKLKNGGGVPSASTVLAGPVIDNVNLVPVAGVVRTPEPASLGVLGLGGLMLLRRKAARGR